MKRVVHSSGFRSLDNLVGGFANGELVLIGGRPAAGVTQLLINLAITFSQKASVFYFTSKHLQTGILNRITSSLSQIPMDMLVRNDLTTNDTKKLAALYSSNPFNRIHLHDCDADAMDSLKSLRQMLFERRRLDFIVVDNLQDLCHSAARGKFIKELKNITKDFGVVVILAADINKAVDARNDKKPKLKDLSKSYSISELPDKIFFVHRPERYRNRVELTIAKNSNGNVGSVQLATDESQTNIIDPIPSDDCLKDR